MKKIYSLIAGSLMLASTASLNAQCAGGRYHDGGQRGIQIKARRRHIRSEANPLIEGIACVAAQGDGQHARAREVQRLNIGDQVKSRVREGHDVAGAGNANRIRTLATNDAGCSGQMSCRREDERVASGAAID